MLPVFLCLIALCLKCVDTATVSSVSVYNNQSTTKGSDIQLVCSMMGFSLGVVYISKTDIPSIPVAVTDPGMSACDKTSCSPRSYGRYSFSSNVNEVTIYIHSLDRLSDQKYWHCVTQDGSHKALQITVYTPPTSLIYINVPAQSQDLSAGPVTLTCETGCAYPQHLLKWFYIDGIGSVEYSTGTSGTTTSGCTDQEKRFSSSLTLAQYTTFTNNEDKTVKFKCGIPAVPAQGIVSPLYSPESPNIRFAVEAGMPELKNKTLDPLLSGDEVRFVCQTTPTRPAALVTWRKGGVQMLNVASSETTGQDGLTTVTSTVTLTPVHADHQKDIVCETAIPGQSSASDDRIQVTVFWSPSTPNITPSSAFPWREGQTDKYILCGAANMGNPTSSETWTSLSGSPQPDGRLKYASLTSSHDEEAVTCKLENAYTQRKNIELISQDIYLDVQYKPIVTVSVNNTERENITVNEGQSLHAVCSARGNPSPHTVEWLAQTGQRAGDLRFPDIDRSDTNTYTCSARATSTQYPGYGLATEKMLYIGVNYAPTVSITISKAQGNIQISCNADGKPSTYTYRGYIHSWRGQQLQDLIQLNRQVWDIRSPQLEDSGNYTCYVDNGIVDRDGQLIQTSSYEILVEGQPIVLSKENTFVGNLSELSNITIQFYSHPPHQSVTIKRGDETLGNTDVMTIVTSAAEITDVLFYGTPVVLQGTRVTLTIQSLTEIDFSDYTLEIQNNQGTAIWPFTVVSQSKPEMPIGFRHIRALQIPTFVWEKGRNGGQNQTFIIEVSPEGNDGWREKLQISEWDPDHILQHGLYIAELRGLDAGSYACRILSRNIFGTSGDSELVSSFSVTTPDNSKLSQGNAEPSPASSIATGVIAGIEAIVIITLIVVIIIVIRNRPVQRKDEGQMKQKGEPRLELQETIDSGSPYDNIGSDAALSETRAEETRNVYEKLDPALKTDGLYEAMETRKDKRKSDKEAEYVNLDV